MDRRKQPRDLTLSDPTRSEASGCSYYHHHGEEDGCYGAEVSGRVS
jgi:hypothetical protein